MIYFTADQHFGDESIIKSCNRPFDDVGVMGDVIVGTYNGMVNDDDTVFMIGDIVVPTNKDWIENYWFYREVMRRLKGQKHLVLGNHDSTDVKLHLDSGFLSVHTHYHLVIEDRQFILAHDPAESCVYREMTYLCGHVHDLFTTVRNVINVGVDRWQFKPVSLEEIMRFRNRGN